MFTELNSCPYSDSGVPDLGFSSASHYTLYCESGLLFPIWPGTCSHKALLGFLKSVAAARQGNPRAFPGNPHPLKAHGQARLVSTFMLNEGGNTFMLNESCSLVFLPFTLAGAPTKGPGQPLLRLQFLIILCSMKTGKYYINTSC